MNNQQRTQVIERIASAAVSEDIDVWPAVRARVALPPPAPSRPWLALAAGVALVVMLGLGLVPGWSTADAVSAETILDRAVTTAAAAAAVRTYHLVLSRQTSVGAPETTISEVWFAGAQRQRTVERVTGSGGALVRTQDVIFNGPETWIVRTENGQTQAIHTFGTTWTKPADDPSTQGTLADLLNQYGQKQCVSARLASTTAMVAGQASYVLEIAPKPMACDARVSVSPIPAQSAARVSGQVSSGRFEGPGQPHVRVWVDKHTFLPLKMEMRDDAGRLVDGSEVTQVDYNVPIPDSVFTYAPPAGVAVATFSGGDGVDVKRALSGGTDAQPRSPKP